jgi:Cro/C1-type HTH DNA-binding domain
VRLGQKQLPHVQRSTKPPPSASRVNVGGDPIFDSCPIRQLPRYLPAAAAPPLEGATRDAVVQLLAHLPVEQVLKYNQDPSHLRDLLLCRLTLEAQKRVAESPLSKREIVRRLGTSAAQLYRLLDQTNYRKSVDQVLALLQVLNCDVDLVVLTKPCACGESIRRPESFPTPWDSTMRRNCASPIAVLRDRAPNTARRLGSDCVRGRYGPTSFRLLQSQPQAGCPCRTEVAPTTEAHRHQVPRHALRQSRRATCTSRRLEIAARTRVRP